ncbi:hypothetical protein JCM11251_007557 [Rhodosporidiobolus azoricus]
MTTDPLKATAASIWSRLPNEQHSPRSSTRGQLAPPHQQQQQQQQQHRQPEGGGAGAGQQRQISPSSRSSSSTASTTHHSRLGSHLSSTASPFHPHPQLEFAPSPRSSISSASWSSPTPESSNSPRDRLSGSATLAPPPVPNSGSNKRLSPHYEQQQQLPQYSHSPRLGGGYANGGLLNSHASTTASGLTGSASTAHLLSPSPHSSSLPLPSSPSPTPHSPALPPSSSSGGVSESAQPLLAEIFSGNPRPHYRPPPLPPTAASHLQPPHQGQQAYPSPRSPLSPPASSVAAGQAENRSYFSAPPPPHSRARSQSSAPSLPRLSHPETSPSNLTSTADMSPSTSSPFYHRASIAAPGPSYPPSSSQPGPPPADQHGFRPSSTLAGGSGHFSASLPTSSVVGSPSGEVQGRYSPFGNGGTAQHQPPPQADPVTGWKPSPTVGPGAGQSHSFSAGWDDDSLLSSATEREREGRSRFRDQWGATTLSSSASSAGTGVGFGGGGGMGGMGRAGGGAAGDGGIGMSNMSPFTRDGARLDLFPPPSSTGGAASHHRHHHGAGGGGGLSASSSLNDTTWGAPGGSLGLGGLSGSAGGAAGMGVGGGGGGGGGGFGPAGSYRARREHSLGAVGTGRKRSDSAWGGVGAGHQRLSDILGGGEEEDGGGGGLGGHHGYGGHGHEDDDVFAPPTRSGATSRRHSFAAFEPPSRGGTTFGFHLPTEPHAAPTSSSSSNNKTSSSGFGPLAPLSSLSGNGNGNGLGSSAINDDDLLAADFNSLQLNLEAHVAGGGGGGGGGGRGTLSHVGSMPVDFPPARGRGSAEREWERTEEPSRSPPPARQHSRGPPEVVVSQPPTSSSTYTSTSTSTSTSTATPTPTPYRATAEPFTPSSSAAARFGGFLGAPAPLPPTTTPATAVVGGPGSRFDFGVGNGNGNGNGGLGPGQYGRGLPPPVPPVTTQHQYYSPLGGGGGGGPLSPRAGPFSSFGSGGAHPSPSIPPPHLPQGHLSQHQTGYFAPPPPPPPMPASSQPPPPHYFPQHPSQQQSGYGAPVPPPSHSHSQYAPAQPSFPPAPALALTSLAQSDISLGRGVPLHAIPPDAPLCIVGFKAGRKDLFFVEDPNLQLNEGDLVIVEADRGRDVGKYLKRCSIDEVHKFQQQLVELALGQLANPQHSPASASSIPLPGMGGFGAGSGGGGGAGAGGGGPSGVAGPAQLARMTKECQPKRIYGKAGPADTHALLQKAQDEVKALALVRSKVAQKGLPMEILDAEWQWDRRKLTFYYTAEQRVDFRELVRELFRIWKTRVWLCCLDQQQPSTFDFK